MQVSDIYEYTNYELGTRHYAFDIAWSGVTCSSRSRDATKFYRAKIITYSGSDKPSHEEARAAINRAIEEWCEHTRKELEEV